MMRQYRKIKEKNPDCLLFFRLGDFYELFGDDAITASRELELVLTTRDRAAPEHERIPMCGVPYHASETYIARLVARGYRIAVCEQLEDPKDAKGLVDRDVIRIVTPGTVTESSMLDEGVPNYLAAVYVSNDDAAVCYADISTGEMAVLSIPDGNIQRLKNTLAVVSPREAILGGRAARDSALLDFLNSKLNCFTQSEEARFFDDYIKNALNARFGEHGAEEYGLHTGSAEAVAVGALLGYANDTRKAPASHLHFSRSGAGYMELDLITIRGMELLASSSTGDKKGSLLWVLDHTKTAMGRRLLRGWVARPLLSPAMITRRQSAVSELVRENVIRSELLQSLRQICDFERLSSKIVYGTASARDLYALACGASDFDALGGLLEEFSSPAICDIRAFDRLNDISGSIFNTICDEPPFSVREGGMIRDGVNAELDRLRGLVTNGGGALSELERSEREKTGIKLKVGYNRVFGYYIEMPRSRAEEAPPEYERRQTLANAERYITPELKQLEAELLTAKDSAAALEYELFKELLDFVASQSDRILATASKLAELDALCSLAQAAVRGNYVCPEVTLGDIIDIRDGRHPVVELTQGESLFVPNDTMLGARDSIAAIITGPNMAGKSTYMRQTALIVLMAQIGSFVPAAYASIGIVDRIFTRIGASDDLAAGKSTFMVEMTEAADILKNATSRSLLIFDEIGRGTSTYDGVAIARAILEYCATRLRAKTLFSTHYHELAEAERECAGVKCYAISAKRRGAELVFLRKITPGGARDSYGIDVANLAGLPRSVVARAREVMGQLTTPNDSLVSVQPVFEENTQISLGDNRAGELADELRRTAVDTLTPIEALNLLYEMKKRLDD